jgi:3-oxoacyl-[acyl-carrier protein] reductase
MDVNANGTFFAIREALHRGVKTIITIGSIHGCTDTSYANRSPYTASKGAVAALTKELAVELGPQGIAVNCVAPGHLPYLMKDTEAGQTLLNAARAKTPTGKLTTPQDVAEVVWFLCNDAPANLTGRVIVLDGGFTLNTYPLK